MLSQWASANAFVIVFDAVGGTRIGQIDIPSTGGPRMGAAGLVLSPDESTLYCAGWEDDGSGTETARRAFLSVIDRASATETHRIQLSLWGVPRNIAISPDGSRVYVTNMTVNDADFDDPMTPGSFLGAIHVVDTATGQEVDTDGVAGNGISPMLTSAPAPSSVAVSLDGRTLYVGHSFPEIVDDFGLLPTANISTFDTTTFTEGVPLVSFANAFGTGGVLLLDPLRNLLYAPRWSVQGTAPEDGLSVFVPGLGAEAIVDTTIGGGAFAMRDVDILWGTPYLVLADVFFGIVVVDVDTLTAVSAAASPSTAAQGVATIPPARH